MLSVYFYKNEKMFQIDLNNDLKEKPEAGVALHYFELVMPRS